MSGTVGLLRYVQVEEKKELEEEAEEEVEEEQGEEVEKEEEEEQGTEGEVEDGVSEGEQVRGASCSSQVASPLCTPGPMRSKIIFLVNLQKGFSVHYKKPKGNTQNAKGNC